MSDTSLQRLEELFTDALARDSDDREAFLDRACAGDEALRSQVRNLLTAHETKDEFLRVPADSDILSRTRENGDVDGLQIGRYTIRRVIATGGMGVVYEAEQEHPNRTVALKVMRHGLVGTEMRQRFRHEVEILGRLQHPNIAQIHEAGVCENASLAGEALPFFAMEMIDGSPLTDYAQDRKLGTCERLQLMIKICQAVHHAHQKGVIHRDLKPSNILVVDEGPTETSKSQKVNRDVKKSKSQKVKKGGRRRIRGPRDYSAPSVPWAPGPFFRPAEDSGLWSRPGHGVRHSIDHASDRRRPAHRNDSLYEPGTTARRRRRTRYSQRRVCAGRGAL